MPNDQHAHTHTHTRYAYIHEQSQSTPSPSLPLYLHSISLSLSLAFTLVHFSGRPSTRITATEALMRSLISLERSSMELSATPPPPLSLQLIKCCEFQQANEKWLEQPKKNKRRKKNSPSLILSLSLSLFPAVAVGVACCADNCVAEAAVVICNGNSNCNAITRSCPLTNDRQLDKWNTSQQQQQEQLKVNGNCPTNRLPHTRPLPRPHTLPFALALQVGEIRATLQQ